MTRYLRAANVKNAHFDLADVKEMNFDPREQRIFGLADGDVLVTEGAGSLDAVGAAATWHDQLDGVVCYQNTLIRLRPLRGTEARFLGWWARHAYESRLFASVAGGANIFHLSAERLKGLPIWLPTNGQQLEIADYLDRETGRIDALVEKKRRLIELLEEKRSASIENALTLGPDLVLASESPRPLRSAAEIRLGRQRSPAHASGPHMVRYLRAANVKDREIHVDDVLEMNFSPNEQRTFALVPGDILVTEGAGSLKAVGAAAVWKGELEGAVCFQNTLVRLRPKRGVSADYLGWWATWAYTSGLFATVAGGANIFHLSVERLKPLPIRVPAMDVQESVVRHIEHTIDRLDLVISTISTQLDLLAEYRQALITAAVTGQLDVRVEAPDPEEALA